MYSYIYVHYLSIFERLFQQIATQAEPLLLQRHAGQWLDQISTLICIFFSYIYVYLSIYLSIYIYSLSSYKEIWMYCDAGGAPPAAAPRRPMAGPNMCASIYAYMHICIYIYTHTHLDQICALLYMHVHIYIYTHTHTQLIVARPDTCAYMYIIYIYASLVYIWLSIYSPIYVYILSIYL